MNKIYLEKIFCHCFYLLAFIFSLTWQAAIVRADESKITPSVTLGQEYIDNLFFSETNRDDDLISTFSPKIAFSNRTERLDALFRAQLSGILYSKHNDLNALDHNYSGHFKYNLKRRMSFYSDASFIKDSRADRDVSTTGILTANILRKSYNASLAGEYIFSEKAFGKISYSYNQDNYDEKNIIRDGVNNFRAHSLSVGGYRYLSYFSPKILIGLRGSYSQYDYKVSKIDYYGLLLDLQRNLNELYKLDLNIGARSTRILFPASSFDASKFRFVINKEENTSSGGTAELTLSYKGELARWSWSISHDVKPASGKEGSTERTSIKLDLYKAFSYKLRGYFYTYYYLNKASAGRLAAVDIDEETFWIEPKLRYNFSRNLSLGCSYIYAGVRDNINKTIRHRNTIKFQLSFQQELIK